MVSYRDRMTWVGATADDEMCNFYMMYWVEGQVWRMSRRYHDDICLQDKLANERCVSVGPPVYNWGRIWPIGGKLHILQWHS